MLRLLLLKFFLPFLTLSFAAGAGLADLDLGAGDAGGEGGDEGDGGADEGGDAGDAGEGGDEGEENLEAGAEGGEEDLDSPVDIGNGRQVPGRWKKLFDEAQKAGLGKEAKQLYFAQQRLNKAIPGGINAAIQLANDIEQLGGVEGIEQMQTNLEAYTADEDLFHDNPEKWVQTSFEADEDAALKAFIHSIDYVGQKFPEQYNHTFAKIIVNDISDGFDITRAHRILAGLKDNPEAQAAAKELLEYWNSRVKTSEKAPQKKAAAVDEKLAQREKAAEEREMSGRYADINRASFPELKESVRQHLLAYGKENSVDLRKISKAYPQEWADALNDIHGRIRNAALKDKRFCDKYYSLVKAGDTARAIAAVNAKHAALAAEAVRTALAGRALFRGKKRAPGAGDAGDKGNKGGGNINNAGAGSWKTVSEKPRRDEIDWSKTPLSLSLEGRYVLTDGTRVQVKY